MLKWNECSSFAKRFKQIPNVSSALTRARWGRENRSQKGFCSLSFRFLSMIKKFPVVDCGNKGKWVNQVTKLFCRTGNACSAPDNEEWLSRKPFNEHMFPILIRDVSTPDRKKPETFPKMENRDSISIFTSKVKNPLESIIYRKGFLWVFSEASLGIPGKW